MITWADYFMGRDVEYASELTPEIKANATRTIKCVNEGLTLFYAHNPGAKPRRSNSGWRPRSVNAAAGGAAHSWHLLALADDLSDEDRALCLWSLRNKDMLISVGILAMERPEATPGWCHWQPVSAGSGVFAYWPTTSAYSDWEKSGKPLMA